MDKIVLALVCLFAFSTPAAADNLVVANGRTGPLAMFSPAPAGGRVYSWDRAWALRNLNLLDQEAMGSVYATMTITQDPIGGEVFSLIGKDLRYPRSTWREIEPPPGTSFGWDTRFSLAGDISPTVDVLVPSLGVAGVVEWWKATPDFRQPAPQMEWLRVGAFGEGAIIDSRGTSACVAETGLSGFILYCDWEEARGSYPGYMSRVLPAPQDASLEGIWMTDDFVVVVWSFPEPGGLTGRAAVALLADGGTVSAPGADYQAASSDAVYYTHGTELRRWTPQTDTHIWNVGDSQYPWIGVLGEDNVLLAEQDVVTGVLGPLTRIY
jgi:hypothetical protein